MHRCRWELVAVSNLSVVLALGPACGDGGAATTPASEEGSTTAGATSTAATSTAATSVDDGSTTTTPADTTSSTTDTAKFDVGTAADDSSGGPPPPPSCKVVDELDAIGACNVQAPPESFDAEIQWTWTGPENEHYSIVTPLVGNLTDDDGDGEIDLCDTPDIVVVVMGNGPGNPGVPGHLWVLDGATGTPHFTIPTSVDSTVTPAMGDLDGDGTMEIVTARTDGRLIAFEHDGAVHWQSDDVWQDAYAASVAMADIDNDGDVEILTANLVTDHEGSRVFTAPVLAANWSATVAADLDDDGDLEIVLGNAAFDHDGVELWHHPDVAPGYPQVANFDDDARPEVLVTNGLGITLIDDDGSVVYQDERPSGDPLGVGDRGWRRPATVHDFDGDDLAEYAVSSMDHYTVHEADASIVWSANVSDQSGIAGGTAFDFLGDGIAEAMYADETKMFVFDGNGDALLQIARASGTLSEYPVVADVDNDGSSEIVVVSNFSPGVESPTVQVIRDAEDRWIQSRRIWNQHTYHVTNVREDGSIPQFEQPHHTLLNTFRTNAQIEDGGVCKPPPAG